MVVDNPRLKIPRHPINIALPPLAKGEVYAGIIVVQGAPLHHLILLPGEIESANWKDALSWAKKQNAELPTRKELALLLANAADRFPKGCHWSAEPYAGDASYAWYQFFDTGGQYHGRQTGERRARAVRRVII